MQCVAQRLHCGFLEGFAARGVGMDGGGYVLQPRAYLDGDGNGRGKLRDARPDGLQAEDEMIRQHAEQDSVRQDAEDGLIRQHAEGQVESGPDLAVTALSGRVTKLELAGKGIAKVELLSDTQHGHVSVNADNSLALVLSHSADLSDLSFGVRVTYSDGRVQDRNVSVDVQKGPQKAWAMNDFYKLETDAQDNIIVEHGENHRKVYVSASDEALTLADIARLEGVDVSRVDGAFLVAHDKYGASEDMALAQDAMRQLWGKLNDPRDNPDGNSNWLLFERGYEYSEINQYSILQPQVNGESGLHPMYIGAFGEGDAPILAEKVFSFKQGSTNVVFQGVHFQGGFEALSGSNILFDGCTFTQHDLSIQGFDYTFDGFTLRNSSIYDVIKESPVDPAGWQAIPDRIAGLYSHNSNNVLIENTFFDHAGWADGYETNGGQTPGKASHNIYLQSSLMNVTLRDSIIMRGAGNDAQIRSGGYIEDNLFLDSNAGVFFAYGDEKGGNYTLFTGNVVTSGAHRYAEGQVGALTQAIENQGYMASLVDNIVTHLADPNNPDELAGKTSTHGALGHVKGAPVYDNTIVYNWEGAGFPEGGNDRNVGNLDKAVLDKTTIQIFTANLLGQKTATIADLADYLRDQADGRLDGNVDADVINAFFMKAFGLGTELRSEATTLRFVPNEIADGVRWDNRLNWHTGDLPGAQDGDSVNLAGNLVAFEGTTTIEDLAFGRGGKLTVNSGRLEVDGEMKVGKGAEISIDRVGQFWTDGYADADVLEITAQSGRFANTGLFVGNAEITASGNAQVLLATGGAQYVMGARSTLTIEGGETRVGFDGQQGQISVAVMSSDASLAFTSADGGIGSISEFYSGRFEQGRGGVISGVNLAGVSLSVDVSGIAAQGRNSYELIHADELIGTFGSVSVTGLGNNQDVKVLIDYDTDRVMLILSDVGNGSGAVNRQTIGVEDSARDRALLYQALTKDYSPAVVQPAPTEPAPTSPTPTDPAPTEPTQPKPTRPGNGPAGGQGTTDDPTPTPGHGSKGKAVVKTGQLLDAESYSKVKIDGSAHDGKGVVIKAIGLKSGLANQLDLGSDDGNSYRFHARQDAPDFAQDLDTVLDKGAIVLNAQKLVMTANDDIFAGAGSDDFVISGGGNDVMRGNGGHDSLRGGKGADVLKGGSGNDLLAGGAGNDKLYGGAHQDTLRGLAGNDMLRGGGGKDTLVGGTGNDDLMGDAGNDRLIGNAGRDTLNGGSGNDRLTGGQDADTFVFSKAHGSDVITDFTLGVDVLEFAFEGGAPSLQIDQVGDHLVVTTAEGTITLLGIDGALVTNDSLFA